MAVKTEGGLSSDRRVSAAVACAVGAAKMERAVSLWVDQLTDEEIARVRRRLCELQNWMAVDIFNERSIANTKVIKWKDEKTAPR